MHTLTSTDALRLWETGHALRPAERAQVLLAAACPGESTEALAGLPIGERNARLLRSRARTLGAMLPCEARCPACDEKLEFALATDALLAAECTPATIRVTYDGRSLTFRLPTDADLMAVLAEGGEAADLIARCALEGDASELPDVVIEEVEAQMAEADPLALLTLDLACPSCGHTWAEVLDVADFFFAELAGQARRTLRDVHRLARAYGWREADVLALSPWRRQQYLALAEG